MEQKQRKVRANPFGEQEEEEGLPSPPEIDDVLKAAEMAQMNSEPEQQMSNRMPAGTALDNNGKLVYIYKAQYGEPEFICICGSETCEIGPFVKRSGMEYVRK